MNQIKQLCYFPYLKLDEYKRIRFFGLSLARLNDIDDLSEFKKDYILKLISVNQRQGSPLENILLVSISKKIIFENLNPSKNKLIEDFRKVLFLISVARSNISIGNLAGYSMATSDNFNIIRQNFNFDENWFSYSSGSLIRKSDGGYEIGEFNFEIPPYVIINPIKLDIDLLNSLKMIKGKDNKFYKLIILSTDAMMQSFYNSDDKSLESRILEQARAFEILFQIPNDKKQRIYFKEKICQLCTLKDERKIRYKYETISKKKWEVGTRHKMWADRFYTLRNHIIHGETVADKEFLFYSQSHHVLALWFFIISLKQLINEKIAKNIFYEKLIFNKDKFTCDNRLQEKILDELKKEGKKLFINN